MTALRSAVPGTTPVLQPGTYRLNIVTHRPGHTRSGVPGVATTCQPGTYRLGRSSVARVVTYVVTAEPSNWAITPAATGWVVHA